MGLDAIVYKSAKSLSEAYGHERFEIDRVTGEATPSSKGGKRIPNDALVAVRKRLGNLDEIRLLREWTGEVIAAGSSIIMCKVLCSASHSGDVILCDEFPKLRAEIEVLRRHNNVRLAPFLEAMGCLIEAGQAEQNPIVFV